MKVAIPALEKNLSSQLDPRFGRAHYLIVLDTKNPDSHTVVDNSSNLTAAQGAGVQASQKMAELGVEAVIAGHVGPKAYNVLQAASIAIYSCTAGTVLDIFDKFKKGELQLLTNHTCTGEKQC